MTYIDFHVFVQAIVHDEAVSKPNPVRLHWVTSCVGIISYIGVVKVGNTLLVAARVDKRVQGGDGRHLRLNPAFTS